MRVIILFFSVVFVCLGFSVPGQDSEASVKLSNTEIKYFSSKINHVNYKLYVSYPLSYYDSTSKKYPVLYLLDADYSFAIAKNITDHLSERNHLREIIIVGIAYDGLNKYRIHRTRDYTPTNSEENVWFKDIQSRNSGGAPKFVSVIQTEITPLIDKECRTNGLRTLAGHSYGGLFSSWVLLTRPNLFNGYIIVSPSLWYDDHLVFRLNEKLSSFTNSTIRAYFAVGNREINENWNMPKDLTDFVEYLERMKLKNISIKEEICEEETHNSVFPRALSNGLRFISGGT